MCGAQSTKETFYIVDFDSQELKLSILRFFIYALLTLCLLACGKHPDEKLLTFPGETMGTTYSIKISNLNKDVDASQIQYDIDAILRNINHVMSTYEKDSELSLLNNNRTDQCIPVSDELFKVLKEAIRISELSDGAFDITVGPLVNLWGFGPETTSTKLPSDEIIQNTLKNVGYHKIELSETENCIKKNNAEIYIDLSAIAKGYAVDRVAEFIESLDIKNYMVEIGGEIRARGKNANEVAWRIGIELPLPWKDSMRRFVHELISLDDLGMATSGDYRNYYEKDGLRYSHTINPKTGKPITHKLASVTVLDQSAMTADALATAFSVLGYEAGHELANRENLPVLFITKEEDGFRDIATKSFQQFTVH